MKTAAREFNAASLFVVVNVDGLDRGVMLREDRPVIVSYRNPSEYMGDFEMVDSAAALADAHSDFIAGRNVWVYRPSVDSWARVNRMEFDRSVYGA